MAVAWLEEEALYTISERGLSGYNTKSTDGKKPKMANIVALGE
jgi:hypothetical protein